VRYHFVYPTKKQVRRIIGENTFGGNNSYLAVGFPTSTKHVSRISAGGERPHVSTDHITIRKKVNEMGKIY
jgi:hypothetical protein